MKICDRHPGVRAIEIVKLENDYSFFDVCQECKTEVLRYLSEPGLVVAKSKRKDSSKDD